MNYIQTNDSVLESDIEKIKINLDKKEILIPSKITARSLKGEILAVQMPSSHKNEPFPTLFWLVHPELIKKISQYEMQGWVGKIETIINSDKEMLDTYLENHQQYIDLRNSFMSDSQKQLFLEKNLNSSGIGGIFYKNNVKCLHLHYAHFLSTQNNLVGNLMNTYLDLEDFLKDI